LIRLAIIVGAVAFAASLFFAFLSARRITTGLEKLAAATGNLSDGRFVFDVPERSDYEVRKLSESFSQMSEELEESRRRLQMMERISAWRDLARVLAHEIRNALSPIRLSIESIRKSVGRGETESAGIVEKCGKTIEHEVRSLENMVNEFASFAKLPEPSPSPQAINDIVREAVALFSGMLDSVKLVEDYGPDLPRSDLDKDQIRRAIGNIVLNAIESMPEGGTLRVRTFLRKIGSKPFVTVRISDSGPGISDEDRSRIFTPYYTTKEKGTGLGLSVAQSIVISHGGRIEFDETEEDEGTAFMLCFPLAGSPDRTRTPPTGSNDDKSNDSR
jgi:nitrogen fixation/metabolism regulation signal transduction histidine kinase